MDPWELQVQEDDAFLRSVGMYAISEAITVEAFQNQDKVRQQTVYRFIAEWAKGQQNRNVETPLS